MTRQEFIKRIGRWCLGSMKRYALFYLAAAVTALLCLFAVHEPDKARIVVEVQMEYNDVFQFFYKSRHAPDFSEDRSEKRFVNGGPGFKTLSFELPYHLTLENMRLDLSMRRKQKQVDLGHVYLIYKTDTIVLFDGEKRNSFVTNDFVERNGHHFALHPKNGAYDPFVFTGDQSIGYDNLMAGQNKLPPFLLLPLAIALLLQFFIFARRAGFTGGFYVAAPCIFVALLLLPQLNTWFDIYKDQNREKRILAEKPEFKDDHAAEFPRQYENYYNDNFGFRSLLVSLGGKIKFYMFGSSAAPVTAAVGKEGWMYLTGTYYHVTRDVKSGRLLADTTVAKLVNRWETRKQWMEADGRKYYKAVWPEKFTVYPEYLPPHMAFIRKDTLLWLDQVLHHMEQKHSTLRLVTISRQLMEEKKKRPLYLHYDSHWNSYAAFMAYHALMQQVAKDFPQLKPHNLDEFDISYEEKKGGDLADMLSVEEKEMVPVFRLKKDSSRVKELPFYNYPANTIVFENKAASTNLSLMVYRDSFTTEMIPFLLPHFKQLVFIWGEPFSRDYISVIDPDIVIESSVSRFITIH